jgi:hypothetical protein
VKNRKRQSCTSGSVGGEGGNILAYPASERAHASPHALPATGVPWRKVSKYNKPAPGFARPREMRGLFNPGYGCCRGASDIAPFCALQFPW